MKNILIYDLHASEAGALSILMDFYDSIAKNDDNTIHWSFIVSTPQLSSFSHITPYCFPWVKKSWFHRLFFEYFYEGKMIKKISPDVLFSMQNFGVNRYNGKQFVYLHLPFILTDYKFEIKRDGIKLWLYQNVIKHFILKSYKKVNAIIVQTEWMKNVLSSEAKINLDRIFVIYPKINMDFINRYRDLSNYRKVFFFPATAFAYKNHFLILQACKLLKQKGICDFKVIFTLNTSGKTDYEKMLIDFTTKHNLSNVEFCGMIKRDQVFELYSRSILLFPSLVESFGMPLLEARLSGSIILSAKTPFAEEILKGYGNAYFYDGDNSKQLALLMEDVMYGRIVYDDNYIGMIERSNNKTLIDILR